MTFSRWARGCAAAVLLGAGVCGCNPVGDSRVDEEREPHFLMGRKLASQMDYDGAVDAYEKALLVNPQSAAAHFELAWLYEGKQNDPAAAIYHYQRFLKLAPGSGKADVAQAHINNCKLELAKTTSAIAPISASAQRDLERLLQENRELKSQVTQLQAFYDSHAPTVMSNAAVQIASNDPALIAPPDLSRRGGNLRSSPTPSPSWDTRPAALVKTHTVASGETMAAIARRYSVSLPALLNANPQVEPKHLRPGSTLNIPSS